MYRYLAMGPGFMMAPLLQTLLMEDISILCTVPLYRGLHRDRAQVLLSVPESRVVLFFLSVVPFLGFYGFSTVSIFPFPRGLFSISKMYKRKSLFPVHTDAPEYVALDCSS